MRRLIRYTRNAHWSWTGFNEERLSQPPPPEISDFLISLLESQDAVVTGIESHELGAAVPSEVIVKEMG